MSIARYLSGSVHIPGIGDLVLGGRGVQKRKLCEAELLRSADETTGNVKTWSAIDPMIKARIKPHAVYFNNSVIVVSWYDRTLERLSLPSGQIGQWTLISCSPTPPLITYSMCVYNGKILISSETTSTCFINKHKKCIIYDFS